MSHSAFTIADLADYDYVIDAARGEREVAWFNEADEVVKGTARSITDSDGQRVGADNDVRDAFMRVTHASGVEGLMKLAEIVELFRAGRFSVGS